MPWPWRRVDYAEGALRLDRFTLLSALTDAIPMAGNFSHEQLARLFGDPMYLVMRTDLLHAFVEKHHRSLGMWPYEAQTIDCEDHRKLFRADMVRGRWKEGLPVPEAVGDIDYWPLPLNGRERGYHADAWGLSHQENVLRVEVYATQTGRWRVSGAEVKLGVVLGA